MAKNLTTVLKALPVERQAGVEARAAMLVALKSHGIEPTSLSENEQYQAQQSVGIKKGVYRFKTHEEADAQAQTGSALVFAQRSRPSIS
jgi:hypothetical protein